MLNELLIILALILANGVFSGAEIAILSLRRTRLAELVESGSPAALAVARLRKEPEDFLATVQIGITVVGATASAFGGASVAAKLAPLVATIPALAPFASQIALGLVVVVVSFLTLVLGELVPKSLALRVGEAYALLIGRPLALLARVGHPLVSLLTGTSNLVLRLFGDRTNFTEVRLSREEIQQIVDEAADAGAVDPHVGEIASRALEFSTLDAYTVMIPRAEVVMVPRDATAAQLAELAQRSGHARVPVYGDSPDRILGFVNLRDALAAAVLGETAISDALLHPIPFIPDAMAAPAVLRKLQEERAHIGLVIDERGTIVGLLTIEDLVEELVGEILSENERPSSTIEREGDGVWVVDGKTPIHEANRALDLELPEDTFSTVAGLCLGLAGAPPAEGVVLETDGGVTLEVVEATPRRVKRVRIRRAGRGGAPAR